MSKIDEIKEKIDIVDIIGKHLGLSKKGQNFWAMCPFHDDTNPSMSISPEKQIFKCFVCGAGGDAIKFVSDFEKISFTEAMSKLASEAGVEYKVSAQKVVKYSDGEQKIINVLHDAVMFFQNAILTDVGKPAFEYITKRGLTQEVLNKFSIGYSPSDDSLSKFLKHKGHSESTMINASLVTRHGKPFQSDRLVFPIKNEHGDIVALSGRSMNNNAVAKYINSTDSVVFNKSKTLYNYSDAKNAISKEKTIYVLEGFMDVIALSRIGVDNAIAIMGTALTAEHIPFIKTSDVVLMLDNDAAGINATTKSIKTLLSNGVKTFVVDNSAGKDADELLEAGNQILEEAILNRTTSFDFIVKLHNIKYSDINPETNEKYLSSINSYLQYGTDVERDFYINKISEIRNISKNIVADKLAVSVSVKKVSSPVAKQYVPPVPPVKSELQAPVQEVKPNMILDKKYECIMIRSMARTEAKNLIEIYSKEMPRHSDAMLQQIGKYLIKITNGATPQAPNSDFKRIIRTIKDEFEPVDDESKFRDLLKKVSYSSLKAEIHYNRLKLNNEADPDRKIRILEKINYLVKEMKRYKGDLDG